MKKTMVFAAVLFSVLLLLPLVTADVYVPPGPGYSLDAWIMSPSTEMPGMGRVPFYLWVFDTQDGSEVGWYYTDGPTYDPILQEHGRKIAKSRPWVPWANKLAIPWSTEVEIAGFIPGVVVAPDQVPPPVEIVITWNGIPWVVTLELPDDQIVGYDYPPKLYPDIHDTYEFAYPAESPYKDAYYNIWVGDLADLMKQMGEEEFLPPEWYETFYGTYNGYWFWYRFHPNVGDWIAYDSMGEVKFPPTYDITALFEYSTSQIWFPHVAFDVMLLEVHKDVFWTSETTLLDVVTIENLGKAPATELDFTQTFPYYSQHGLTVGIIPNWASAMARIDGPIRTVGWTTLPGFGDSWPYYFTGELSYLNPGEIMTIRLELSLDNPNNWAGTIVFDSMVSAREIPPWKEPIALHSVTFGFVQRFVVMIGDNVAHAAPEGQDYFANPTAYGGDPGPDEVMFTDDDLGYFSVLQALADQGITVFTVNYGPQFGDTRLNFETIAGMTGGVYYAGGTDWDVQIANEIQNRIDAVGARDRQGDVVFVFDLTGSMHGNIPDVKTKIKSIIDGVGMDVTFGLGTHVDYPAFYDSYGYAAPYGAPPDYAWNMDLDLTHDRELVKNTVDAIDPTPYVGGDGPQNYVRVLFETMFFSWRGPSATYWVPLWTGWKLYYHWCPWMETWHWSFDIISEWFVPAPILREKLTHPPPEMVLDPVPVDLNGDGTIDALDVSLVRQAIVGLVAYDLRMDVNVNSEIDTADLAAYKLAAN